MRFFVIKNDLQNRYIEAIIQYVHYITFVSIFYSLFYFWKYSNFIHPWRVNYIIIFFKELYIMYE